MAATAPVEAFGGGGAMFHPRMGGIGHGFGGLGLAGLGLGLAAGGSYGAPAGDGYASNDSYGHGDDDVCQRTVMAAEG